MSVRVCVCVCVCVCVKSAQQHDTDRLLMVRTVTSPGYRSCTSDRRPSHLKERRTAGTGTGTKANNGAVQDSNTTEGHDHIAEVTVAAHARKRGGRALGWLVRETQLYSHTVFSAIKKRTHFGLSGTQPRPFPC